MATTRTQAGRAGRLATVAGLALVLGAGPATRPALVSAADPDGRADRVSVFATVPSPGHPFGVAVDAGRVYVSTSAGDFFADPANGGHRNSDDERVFTYDADGTLLRTARVDTPPDATMGLFGIAIDGGSGSHGRLFVADMNGRILRLGLGPRAGAPTVFSQVPASSGLAGDWMLSMWNDLAFDRGGNLLVTDDKPRIWRVAPDGTASIWFTDSRLAGYFGFAGGPLGGRIDPSGEWLYVSVTASAQFPLEGVIYRIRLVDEPTAADLEVVHRFPLVPGQEPPQPSGIAFAASGNLYVSLLGANQVAVLSPSGEELRRISSPDFHSPWGLAFLGRSLLVTNGDLEPADNPAAWTVFKVAVGERGLPLNQP